MYGIVFSLTPPYFKFWRPLQSLEDLSNSISHLNSSQRIVNLRHNIRIAVIDDEGFPPIDNLRSNHYNITLLDDLTDIYQVEPYHILLCDLKGVGTRLNPTLQGAHIIKEVKENFQDKITIAYTGGSESNLIQQSISIADRYLQKDSDLDTWCETLDDSIKKLVDPIAVWKKIRQRLLDNGATPFHIALLEDCYVRHYHQGQEQSIQALNESLKKLNVKSTVKSIVDSFIASTLFALIFG